MSLDILTYYQLCARHDLTSKCVFPYDVLECGCVADVRRPCCFGDWDIAEADKILRNENESRNIFFTQIDDLKKRQSDIDEGDKKFLVKLKIDPNSFFDPE